MSLTDPSDQFPVNGDYHQESSLEDAAGSSSDASGCNQTVFSVLTKQIRPTDADVDTHIEGTDTMSSLDHNSMSRYSEESYLKSIFDNFNELYQSKIAWIQKTMPDGNDPSVIAAKKDVLESWITDMMAQNSALIKTVEDLEVEAEKKVQILQRKVREAATAAGEHMTMIKEYEEQIKHLAEQKQELEKEAKVLRERDAQLLLEKTKLVKRVKVLEADNTNLVTLIHRIRDLGVWNTDDLELSEHTYDSIFGLYPSLIGSEVQPVFTLQKALNTEITDNRIAQLESQVKDLEEVKFCVKRLLQETPESPEILSCLQNVIKENEERHHKLVEEFNPPRVEDRYSEEPETRSLGLCLPNTLQLEELMKENEELKQQNDQLMKANLNLANEKSDAISSFEHELQQKDVEITMQKIITTVSDELHTALHDVASLEASMKISRHKVAANRDKVADSITSLHELQKSITKLQAEMRSLEKDELLEKSFRLLGRVDTDHRYFCGDGDFSVIAPNDDCVIRGEYCPTMEAFRKRCYAIKSQLQEEFLKFRNLHQEVQWSSEQAISMSHAIRRVIHEAQKEVSALKTSKEDVENKAEIVNENYKLQKDINELNLLLKSRGEKDNSAIHESLEAIRNGYDELKRTSESQKIKLEKKGRRVISPQAEKLDSRYDLDSDSSEIDNISNFENPLGTRGDDNQNAICKLLWLASALRKKLQKKKEREILHVKEKDALVKLMCSVISTWETLRGGYDVLQEENTFLREVLENDEYRIQNH